MTNQAITELIRPPQVLDALDTVRRAAGVIRASEGSRMLVIRDGRVTGSVSEQAIAAFLGSVPDPETALDQPIDSLIEYYPVYASPSITATEAAKLFAEHKVDMLPVVDEHGGLRGALYRSDVIGLLTRNLRPPSVGGMATPLGVYLTTGSISGGAGSLGLYLTGLSLGLMMMSSKLVGEKVMIVLQALVIHKLPAMARACVTYDIFNLGSAILSIALMLLLLRLSPLAGYHAAEHMTVHAIESGDDLSMEAVRRYPRVHPRCGTNLLGAVSIFILITAQFSGEIAAMVAIAVVMLGRRAIGDWMQTVFTTKHPSDRQLANGLAAGDEILRRFHEHPSYQAYGFKRVWNMGFLQAAAGMATVLTVVFFVEKFSHRSLLF